MGLQEKRAIKAFEENKFAALKEKLFSTLGYEAELDVNWEQLATDKNADQYDEAIPNVYFQPLFDYFSEVCADDMGKEAVKDVLKKIIIKNEGGVWSATEWASFENGVLTLNHETTTNSGNIEDRVYYLKAVIDKAL